MNKLSQPKEYWYVKHTGGNIRWFRTEDAAYEFYKSKEFVSLPQRKVVRGYEKMQEVESLIKLHESAMDKQSFSAAVMQHRALRDA